MRTFIESTKKSIKSTCAIKQMYILIVYDDEKTNILPPPLSLTPVGPILQGYSVLKQGRRGSLEISGGGQNKCMCNNFQRNTEGGGGLYDNMKKRQTEIQRNNNTDRQTKRKKVRGRKKETELVRKRDIRSFFSDFSTLHNPIITHYSVSTH